MKAILREFYPEAYVRLWIYSKNSNNKRYRDFIAVRRFIKCNFGLYDNMIDVDENWNFNFEVVGCPLRGECKHDKVICAPKFNSKLSDRQIEVMRMLYDGKNDSEIAEKLFISLNTVNNHRKNSFRKVGVHSMAEFMRYAMTNNFSNNKCNTDERRNFSKPYPMWRYATSWHYCPCWGIVL